MQTALAAADLPAEPDQSQADVPLPASAVHAGVATLTAAVPAVPAALKLDLPAVHAVPAGWKAAVPAVHGLAEAAGGSLAADLGG